MSLLLRRICIFIALVFAAPLSFACTKNNHIRPFDFVSDDVHKLLEERDFKQLEALAHDYEEKNRATTDGYSSLMAFFQGISYGFNNCAKRNPKTETEWVAHWHLLKDWGATYPGSTASQIAMAYFMEDYAWHGRNGNTYGDSQIGQRLFTQRMNFSEELLESIAEACKNNPAWYDAMLMLGLAEGWDVEKFDEIYHQGVKIDPYYVSMYYERADFYSPSWYGSVEERQRVINEAVLSTRERLGETMYARLHWTYSEDGHMFDGGGVDWRRMKKGFEDYLTVFSDKLTRNHFARFACMAKDRAVLKRQFEALSDNIMPELWGTPAFLDGCKAYAKKVNQHAPLMPPA